METAVHVVAPNPVGLLAELDSLQDDVLRQLEDLNQQIERAIVGSQLNVRAAEITLTRFQQ
jgi:hypothetical protein